MSGSFCRIYRDRNRLSRGSVARITTAAAFRCWTLEITDAGNSLKGVYRGEHGESSISSALVFGDEVTFDVARDRDGKKYRLHFQGKIKGDTLSGNVDYDFDGMTGYIGFTGERMSAPQASADKVH